MPAACAWFVLVLGPARVPNQIHIISSCPVWLVYVLAGITPLTYAAAAAAAQDAAVAYVPTSHCCCPHLAYTAAALAAAQSAAQTAAAAAAPLADVSAVPAAAAAAHLLRYNQRSHLAVVWQPCARLVL